MQIAGQLVFSNPQFPRTSYGSRFPGRATWGPGAGPLLTRSPRPLPKVRPWLGLFGRFSVRIVTCSPDSSLRRHKRDRRSLPHCMGAARATEPICARGMPARLSLTTSSMITATGTWASQRPPIPCRSPWRHKPGDSNGPRPDEIPPWYFPFREAAPRGPGKAFVAPLGL